MTRRSRGLKAFSNPFYVALLVFSTVFVIATLGYLVSPFALVEGRMAAGGRSRELAIWLDQKGPILLGVLFGMMLITSLLAMAMDDWFSGDRESTEFRDSRRAGR